MLRNMREWIRPPVFEGDEEKTRIAGLTSIILWSTVIAVGLASIFVVVVLQNYLVMGISAVSMLLPSGIAIALLRGGRVRAAAILTVVTLWLILAVMGYVFGGVVNTSYTTMVVIIIIAALLLGGRAAIAVAFLSFAAATVAWISLEIGILPPSLAENPPVNYWVTHTVNFVIAGLLLYLAMGNLSTAIQRARQSAVEAETQREQLQVAVGERTQDLERSASYLRATTAIATESAAVMGDPQQLFRRVVQVIGDVFGF